jgi:hypothetical protein
MGFPVEDLSTPESLAIWDTWRQRACQPNFWSHVSPPASQSCGPYQPDEHDEGTDSQVLPEGRESIRMTFEETVLVPESVLGQNSGGSETGGEEKGAGAGGRKMKVPEQGRSRFGWGKGVEKWDVDDR